MYLHPIQETNDCIGMFGNNDAQMGQWDDKFCSDDTSYICKGPVSSSNPEPVAEKCSVQGFDSFVPFRSECYWESDKQLSWAEAETDCQQKGANLVSILGKHSKYILPPFTFFKCAPKSHHFENEIGVK